MRGKFITLALSLVLAVIVSKDGASTRRGRDGLGDRQRSVPPPDAAASISPSAGPCIQFISVFVPSHGGDYVVGLSFAYRDLDGDGHYTPGVDRLDVCVNCSDACGFGP